MPVSNQLLNALLPPLAVAVMYRKDRALVRELLASGSFTNAIDIASSVTGDSSTMIRKGAIHTIAAALDSMNFPSQQIRWLYGKSPRLAVWVLAVALQNDPTASSRTLYTVRWIRRWCEGYENTSQLRGEAYDLRNTRIISEYQCYLLILSITALENKKQYLSEATGSIEASLGVDGLRESIVRSVRTLAND